MKTKNAVLSFCLLIVSAALAQTPAVPPKGEPDRAPNAAPNRRMELMRQAGGMLMPRAEGPGVMVAAMCGGTVTATVYSAAQELGRTALLPFRYAKRQPADTLWKSAEETLALEDVAFAVLVVDQEGLPALVAAPESRWAAVNVAPLRADADADLFARRVSQEVWRAACFAMGGADSLVNKCVMSPVSSVSDLDALGPHANPEYLNKMLRRAAGAGIKPVRPVTYRKAVEEGWASPPANPVQQAVWDEVKQAK